MKKINELSLAKELISFPSITPLDAGAINKKLGLMQCNTNYTASLDNFKYINLNVLKTYKKLYPEILLGLSDHTPGHTTVLVAVALGAKIIEKHFTDNNEIVFVSN